MAANRALFTSSTVDLYLRQNSFELLHVLGRFYFKSAGKVASSLVQKSSVKLSKNDDGKKTNLIEEQDLTSQEQNKRKFRVRPKSERLDVDKVDWPSLYTTASSYNSWLMPLPVRMGRSRHNKVGGLPLRDMGNIELMKIPNFFHLTPPAIERHCQALKDLCTPWPESLVNRPIRVITKNYLFAGPSLRHPKSHIVHLKVFLKDLVLDDHARRKMVNLAGLRYNKENDELTIVADRCPTRKQNKDYASYLLNVLYHESWKTESWELEVETDPEDSDMPSKTRYRRHSKYKIIGNELYRVNKYGKAFKVYVKQHGDRFPYDH